MRLARLLALAQLREREVEVDAAAVGRALAGVREQLEAIRALKTQLTSVSNATKAVSDGLDTLRDGHPGAGRRGGGGAQGGERRVAGRARPEPALRRGAGAGDRLPPRRTMNREDPRRGLRASARGTRGPASRAAGRRSLPHPAQPVVAGPATATRSPLASSAPSASPSRRVMALAGRTGARAGPPLAAPAPDPGPPRRPPSGRRTLDAADRWIVVLARRRGARGRDRRAHGARGQPGPDVQQRRPRLLGEAGRAASSRAPRGPGRGERRPRRRHLARRPDRAHRRPTRVRDPLNPIAQINGTDERVDADVAIVDTGIDRHPPGPQRGRRRQLLHHEPHRMGRRATATARTSPAPWGRSTTGSASSAWPPACGCGRCGSSTRPGNGLISWYVCGLDWITAQRDPGRPDAARCSRP